MRERLIKPSIELDNNNALRPKNQVVKRGRVMEKWNLIQRTSSIENANEDSNVLENYVSMTTYSSSFPPKKAAKERGTNHDFDETRAPKRRGRKIRPPIPRLACGWCGLNDMGNGCVPSHVDVVDIVQEQDSWSLCKKLLVRKRAHSARERQQIRLWNNTQENLGSSNFGVHVAVRFPSSTTFLIAKQVT